jgi:hypothetical protein
MVEPIDVEIRKKTTPQGLVIWEGTGASEGLTVTSLEVQAIRLWAEVQALGIAEHAVEADPLGVYEDPHPIAWLRTFIESIDFPAEMPEGKDFAIDKLRDVARSGGLDLADYFSQAAAELDEVLATMLLYGKRRAHEGGRKVENLGVGEAPPRRVPC